MDAIGWTRALPSRSTIVHAAVVIGMLVGAAYALASTLAPVARSAPPRLVAPEALAASPGDSVAVFAGGCFWGIQAVFEHVRGVRSATSGYSGGTTASPSYEEVSSGTTGHAESVRVVYDPAEVSYADLLRVFFAEHDPTELDRQGPDRGTQYRSAIFYLSAAQKRTAEAYVRQLARARTYPRPIVTEIVRFRAFYPAEAYHQDYALHHPDSPYILFNDAPKIANLRRQFPSIYRDYTGSRSAEN